MTRGDGATAGEPEGGGSGHVHVRREQRVVVIELRRPASLNAFNVQMARELHATLERIDADASVGAVLLTGAGRAFSAGLDLKASGVPRLASGGLDTRWALRELFNPIVLLLREMRQPVIAAVNGVAAGIGCSLALACDLVLAARTATLSLAFVKLALVLDGGSSMLVSARAGTGRALEMALLGEPLGAEQALQWGLVNRVAEDHHLLEEALELSHRLAAGSAEAHAEIKRLLNAPHLEQLREALTREADAQGARSGSAEVLAALSAFSERSRSASSASRPLA